MTSIETRLGSINQPLEYFCEWGGAKWTALLRQGLDTINEGRTFEGLRLLEIGGRYGKLTSLMALLGAEVDSVDIDSRTLPIARAEAARWGVEHRASFKQYDGDLNKLPAQHYDVIYTKSVLVLIPDLAKFLGQMPRIMRGSKRVLFIENSKGHPILHALRRFRHRSSWDHRKARYFENDSIAAVRGQFVVDLQRSVSFPPIVMLAGRVPQA